MQKRFNIFIFFNVFSFSTKKLNYVINFYNIGYIYIFITQNFELHLINHRSRLSFQLFICHVNLLLAQLISCFDGLNISLQEKIALVTLLMKIYDITK